MGSRPVVQLSARGCTDDRLWFALFHELGHVLLDKQSKRTFIELKDQQDSSAEETAADDFARDTLIPPEEYRSFVDGRTRFSRQDVSAFARRIGIAQGVVVGRLQHDGHLPMSHLNALKRRIPWQWLEGKSLPGL